MAAVASRCADAAWLRARAASHLRHAARAQGKSRAAEALSKLKLSHIQRVALLTPAAVRIKPHRVRGHKLDLIRYRSQSLHVPRGAVSLILN